MIHKFKQGDDYILLDVKTLRTTEFKKLSSRQVLLKVH